MLSQNNILFMFLGNVLSKENKDLYEHWSNFLEKSDSSLHIILHPKKYIETINDPLWENIIIVDKDHHIDTEWGDQSLVHATLLMIQYAIKIKGNIFKKFVLLSDSCCPLYKYDIIKTELLKNNKSWLHSYFKSNDKWSQWFALDNTHLEYFFDISDNVLVNKYDKYQELDDYVPDETFFGTILIKNNADIYTLNIKDITNYTIIDKTLDNWMNDFTNDLIITFKSECLYNNIYIGYNYENIKISPTYADWSGFSLDPNNIFRNFSIIDILADCEIYNNNTKWYDFNIEEYLNMSPKDGFNMIKENEEDLMLEYFKGDIHNYILTPWYHPIEYSSWNMKNIINSFNLMTLFRHMCGLTKENRSDKMLYVLQIYEHLIHTFFAKNKIIKEDYLYIDSRTTCKYIICDNIDSINEKIYGNTITSTILNNALSSGCLFIRKCIKDSKINIYSKALLKIDRYVMN